ncbi:MAG: amidohydrolase family protein [Psychromonas sp.]
MSSMLNKTACSSLNLYPFPLFDSHLHIIDNRFPLIQNNGYLPPIFTHQQYLARMSEYHLTGGVIVSGSFQANDQGYLIQALTDLGDAFVGITQLSVDVSDQQILQLNTKGVRGVRFNLRRGDKDVIRHLTYMAQRVHELAKWHVELYVDAKELNELYSTLLKLPALSIDHLGLSHAGVKLLIKMAEKGVKVKATGFSRVDFNVPLILKSLYAANPSALMFGSDLPSTRAPRDYSDNDFIMVADTLGESAALKVFSENAINFYKPSNTNCGTS